MPYSQTPEIGNTGFSYFIFLNSGSILTVQYRVENPDMTQQEQEAEFQTLVDKLADYPDAYQQRGTKNVSNSYECMPTPPE